MSMAGSYAADWCVMDAPLDVRVQFIRRTYLHLAGAIAAFTLLSVLLFQIGVGVMILNLIAGFRWGWLLFLGAFSVAGWLASSMAQSSRQVGAQYAGLGFYTLAEAVLFSPLIALAALFVPGALPLAAAITLITFAGLSAYVLITKQDFSFLRMALVVGGIVAMCAIVAGVIFGFDLGIWFSAAMILFACGAILYSTSKVLHNYAPDQHVAASLELFAAVALLFWYVLQLLMRLQRR